ncbi:hypothetical protein ILUMI_01265 [Ignelater luminosus]|uniref:SPIN-DOC-like zinc-finger domain-containing protein n=1 Tax=Ignelater luminosus TaxID=2038154 RepID=A0A8K0DIU6_IGNLU|nr:hypothetical protein ILUMI_01265 [Ignelater luminosus]
MNEAKKRRLDIQCRKFKEEWTRKYLFQNIQNKAVCLVCNDTIAVFKKYNLKRHFSTKHCEYEAVSSDELKKLSETLQKRWVKQQCIFAQQSKTLNTECSPIAITEYLPTATNDYNRAAITKASYLVAHKIAKKCKPFVDCEFLKECMVEVSELLCPDKKHLFENISLSRRTFVRRIDNISHNLLTQLHLRAENFIFCSLALETCDIAETSQLSIFVRGINDDFEITEELLALYPLKSTTTDEDLFSAVQECMTKAHITWNKVVNITTDSCPRLTGLLKMITDKIKEINPDKEIIILHCIIHQEVLCKKVLKCDHIVTVLLSLPFSFNIDDAPANIQLQLIDIQSNQLLKEEFKNKSLVQFYASLDKKDFDELRNYAQLFLAIFGSSITDEKLQSAIRIATSELHPDFEGIIKLEHNRLHDSH